MVQCRLDSKSGLFTDCVVSRVDFSLCDVTSSSKPVAAAKDGVDTTTIFLATVFAEKRHPYTRGLLSIEQNCGILTNNTCKKSFFHAYHL